MRVRTSRTTPVAGQTQTALTEPVPLAFGDLRPTELNILILGPQLVGVGNVVLSLRKIGRLPGIIQADVDHFGRWLLVRNLRGLQCRQI